MMYIKEGDGARAITCLICRQQLMVEIEVLNTAAAAAAGAMEVPSVPRTEGERGGRGGRGRAQILRHSFGDVLK